MTRRPEFGAVQPKLRQRHDWHFRRGSETWGLTYNTLWQHETIEIDGDVALRLMIEFPWEHYDDWDTTFLLTVLVGTMRQSYRWRARRTYLTEEELERLREEWDTSDIPEGSSCVPVDVFPDPDMFVEACQVENERRRLAMLTELIVRTRLLRGAHAE